MDKVKFQTIDAISRQFEMSQVWLHQLRIAGEIETKCVKNFKGKQFILWNANDVDIWIKEHPDEYKDRHRQGYYDRVSKAYTPI